jgi:hypothetical protein
MRSQYRSPLAPRGTRPATPPLRILFSAA